VTETDAVTDALRVVDGETLGDGEGDGDGLIAVKVKAVTLCFQ